MAQEIFAVFGERELARGPVQKRATHLLLKSPDLMADSGLGQMKPLSRPSETASFADGDEGAQQCGFKVHRSNI